MVTTVGPIEKAFWLYVHGNLSDADFEAWVYSAPGLEQVLGETDWIALVSLDFEDKSRQAGQTRRSAVQRWAEAHFPRACACQSAPKSFWRDIGNPLAMKGVVVARRTPWIELRRCQGCGADWMVGVDTVEDDFRYVGLSRGEASLIVDEDRWPADFDDRANLWPDEAWLKAFGYASLEAWRLANDPACRRVPK
jgi:hypothetical protein